MARIPILSHAQKILVFNFWFLAGVSIALIVLTVSFFVFEVTLAATSATIGLVLADSVLSLVFVISHTVNAAQKRKLQTENEPRPNNLLNQVCLRLPGLLTVCWVVPVVTGMVTIVKQSICKPASTTGSTWWKAAGCQLYRIIVALTILALLATSSIFGVLECLNRNAPKDFVIVRERQKSEDSESSADATTNLYEQDRPEGLYLIPETRTSRIEHEQWLQRRNSMSSQRAVYPSGYRTFSSQRYARTRSPSARLFSLSETSTLSFTDTRSSYSASIGSSMYSGGSGNSGPGSTGSQLSSMGSSVSDIPLPPMPTKYKNSPHRRSSIPSEPAELPVPRISTPPPPSWCPSTLRHAPLSSDPTIRALSLGSKEHHKPAASTSLAEIKILPAAATPVLLQQKSAALTPVRTPSKTTSMLPRSQHASIRTARTNNSIASNASVQSTPTPTLVSKSISRPRSFAPSYLNGSRSALRRPSPIRRPSYRRHHPHLPPHHQHQSMRRPRGRELETDLRHVYPYSCSVSSRATGSTISAILSPAGDGGWVRTESCWESIRE